VADVHAGPAPTDVCNVSRGGVGLVARSWAEPGAVVLVEFRNGPRGVALSVNARVVHARRMAGGAWYLGCAFVRELVAEELRRLL
jgi:hypothetical protein